MNPTVPQSVVDEAMERDPASAFAEYNAIFREDVESFVALEAVRACVNAGAQPSAIPRRDRVLLRGREGRRSRCIARALRHNCRLRTGDCVSPFAGRDVLILQDMDETGRKGALKAAQVLHGIAKSVRIVQLPGLDGERRARMCPIGSTADARNAGKLVQVCFDAPLWTPATPAPDTPAPAAPCRPSSHYRAPNLSRGFVPPDYLVVGWLQRRFVYSLTAATGDGKTAIALLVALLVRQGFKLGKLEVKRGRVLYFAGENPDDVRMRWMATTQQFALVPEDIDNVHFVPGVFKFTEIGERIRQEMAANELALVVVPTSAAYFETDDENNNMQALAHAKRLAN
jgi:hypothetical protein